jgi:hypothetical protein
MGRFDAFTQITKKPTPSTPPPVISSLTPNIPVSLTPTTRSETKTPEISEQPAERANAPTPQRPNQRRIITRNSFEIYEDQMDTLRKLASKELETKGKIGSMSAMVREAIEEFIANRTSEK